MTILDSPLLTPPDRVPTFDVLGWVLRIAAGGIFLSVGLTKFESQSLWVGLFAQIGLGDWFRYLTGALQVTGGALFLIPRTTRIAAAIAGSTMVGAIFAHVFVLPTGIGGAIIPLALLVFTIVVATRREPDPPASGSTFR
jgi:putative oxidoreductase